MACTRTLKLMPIILALSACSVEPSLTRPPAAPAGMAPIPASISVPQAGADTGFEASATADTVVLGSGVASLGSPAISGVWIKAPILKHEGPVEIHVPDTGRSVQAEGAPSSGVVQMSLAAYQALGASPAELVSIELREVLQ